MKSIIAFIVAFTLQAIPAMASAERGADSEALYELAYDPMGVGQAPSHNKRQAAVILQSLKERGDAYAAALGDFIHKRSLTKAETLLALSQTPRQRALAFMCLAEAYFAQRNVPKAMLYTTLSMATYPSESRDRQAQFYLKEATGVTVSFLRPRDELLKTLNEAMEKETNSAKFRALFDVATVVGLLPDYPLKVWESSGSSPLQLCLAFDEKYAKHASVVLLSAMVSAKPSTRYAFTVLEDYRKPLLPESKAHLKALMKSLGENRFSIQFVEITDGMLPPLPTPSKCWSRHVYFKILIPELFKNEDKTLYLDADMIVRRDITPMYQAPMGKNFILGARDICAAKYLERLELPVKGQYINGGMILFNNAELKRTGEGAQLVSVFEERPDIVAKLAFNEQDLLALMFQGKILEWGAQVYMEPEERTSTNLWNWFAQKHPSTKWSAIHKHFAGLIHMESPATKPWKRKKSYSKWLKAPKENMGICDLYWSLRDMGPWPVTVKGRPRNVG